MGGTSGADARAAGGGQPLRADAVFEGGGVKGIGLVGALAVAEERGYRWQNVAGTSAGAIVAALVAAGFGAAEIKAKMDGLDYQDLLDRSWWEKLPGAFVISLGVEKGIYEGDVFEDLMRSYLAEKGVRTFRDLRDEVAEDERYRYKLQVIASDITHGRMVLFPQHARRYGIDPDDLDVARAVRMSMSIPFFFEPVTLPPWPRQSTESVIVDGGVLSNYPVWLFDVRGSELPEWPTFGFRLAEPEPAEFGLRDLPILGPVGLLVRLVLTAMEARNAWDIEDDDSWARTIAIPTLGVRTTDFDLGRELSDRLYASGRSAATAFFDGDGTTAGWDFARYVERYRGSRPGRRIRIEAAQEQLLAL